MVNNLIHKCQVLVGWVVFFVFLAWSEPCHFPQYCRDVTRPVCITRTELECEGGAAQPQLDPANLPTTKFEGTDSPVVGLGRSQPLQPLQPLAILAPAETAGLRRQDGEDLRGELDQPSNSNRTLEEFFLSTGVFQRAAGDPVRRRPVIVPKRFKKQTNRRQEDTGDSDGSLEEIFLSAGVFQRSLQDRIRSDSQPELRRARRQTGGNCVAVLKNDCEDAVIQQCQIDKRERCSRVPAVKCEPAGPPVRQCRSVPRQQCGLVSKQQCRSARQTESH